MINLYGLPRRNTGLINQTPTTLNDKRGFTFIELLVVITIIGVIFASAIVTFTSITTRSRDTRRKADLEAVRQSLEMCRSLTGAYPDTIYDEISCSVSGPILLKNTPHDPKPCSDLVGAYSYDKASSTEYTLSAPCMEIDTTYQVTNP